MFVRFFARMVAVIGLALLVACGGGGTDSDATGTLVLSATDAPFPGLDCLAAAKIEIWKIEAKGSDGFVEIPLANPDPEEDPDADPPEGPAAPKPPEGVATTTVDLLQLVAGLTEFLGQAEVPAGSYSEIRLHLVQAELEFADDETDPDNPVPFDPQPFKVPSGMSSGLKIKIDPPVLIAEGATVQLVLDVDLAESFHTTGLGHTPTCDDLREGETKVIFHPVVRLVNENESGMVSGRVLDGDTGVGGAQIAALPADVDDPGVIDPAEGTEGAEDAEDAEPVAKTISAEDGAYALFLEPGEYDLYVMAEGYAETWTLALEGVVVATATTTSDQDIDLATLATTPSAE